MIGRRLAHYEIVGKLGEGGMGVVWKARDTHLDRFVALKVLTSETTPDTERRRRFDREARAASALNHPGIVTIYDIAEADSNVFIAMEYVEGRTLADLIGLHGIEVKAALNYAIQAAQALAKAHAAGIVHRDLKPSNIMVTSDGLVKIVDFGIAKLARSATEASSDPPDDVTDTLHTREGAIFGTAAYMSPEQAEGFAVDARSDIFSFGAVLYEMVTGVQAFQGASKISTLAAVLTREPTPPSEILETVPRALERIILRCLQKEPARRVQVMADLVVELQEIKAESASGILPVPRSRRASPIRRRLLALAAVIPLLGAAAWLVRYLRLPPLPAARVLPLTSSPGDERLPAFSPDGKMVAFVWSGEKRDNTDIYLKPADGGTPLRLTTDPGEDTAPAWSPDGRQIAFVRRIGRQATIYLTPPVPASETKLAEFRPSNTTNSTIVGQMVTLSWFPNGEWLAVPIQETQSTVPLSGTYGIVALPIKGGDPRRLTSTADGRHQFPVVSPDGATLAYAACVFDSVCDIHAISLGPGPETRGSPRRLTQQKAGIQGVAWTADGRAIIYSSRIDGQHLWRVAPSGGEPERLEIAGTEAVYPAVAPAGDKLAFIRQGSGDSDLWKFENGGSPESILSSTLADYGPQWAPDGKRIAFASDRSGRGPQIWVASPDGTNLRAVTEPTGRSQGTPRWSPDSRWIAYDGQGDEGTSHIYVVEAAGGRSRRLTTDTGTEQFPSWSRDGRWVYYRSSTGGWQVWRTPVDGGPPQRMTDDGGRGPWESWDGRTLFYANNGALWARPLAGGPTTRVLPSVHQWDFFPVDGGIYYILVPDPAIRYALELRYLDLATGQTRLLTKFESQEGNGLSVSPDGKTALYSGVRMTAGDDLVVILNFR